MSKRILAIAASAFFACTARADLIAGWDFQTTTSGGTAVLASPNTPTSLTANVGSGVLSLDGTNGSSTWTVGGSTEVSAFAGTAANAGAGMSTTTTSPAALALANSSANGKFLTLAFSMTGFADLVLSYATQRTTTGFTTQAWDFSTDGFTWLPVQTFTTEIPSSFGTLTTSTITGLDNQATSFLRLTVSGASATTGNNRLDNIQLNANVVPEPASAGLLALGLLLLRRRR